MIMQTLRLGVQRTKMGINTKSAKQRKIVNKYLLYNNWPLQQIYGNTLRLFTHYYDMYVFIVRFWTFFFVVVTSP